MGEIVRTTTERVVKSIIYDGFSYRLDRARDKVIDWRCMNSKLKCKARITTGATEKSCAELMSICAQLMNHHAGRYWVYSDLYQERALSCSRGV